MKDSDAILSVSTLLHKQRKHAEQLNKIKDNTIRSFILFHNERKPLTQDKI